MKEWICRNWLKLVKYLFGLLIAGFICWGFVSFSKDDNWLAVSALAMLVLAAAAFISIRQVSINQRREKRESLLNEIIDWALEIQTNSLEVGIPLGTNLSVEQMRRNAEANSLFRYGKTFAKNDYIRAIANGEFGKDLKIEVEKAISIFTAFLFLKGSSFGMKNVKESFGGTAASIMDELEEKIKDNPERLEELLEDYSEKIAISLNKLLLKAAKIKTRDIS